MAVGTVGMSVPRTKTHDTMPRHPSKVRDVNAAKEEKALERRFARITAPGNARSMAAMFRGRLLSRDQARAYERAERMFIPVLTSKHLTVKQKVAYYVRPLLNRADDGSQLLLLSLLQDRKGKFGLIMKALTDEMLSDKKCVKYLKAIVRRKVSNPMQAKCRKIARRMLNRRAVVQKACARIFVRYAKVISRRAVGLAIRNCTNLGVKSPLYYRCVRKATNAKSLNACMRRLGRSTSHHF